MKRLALLAFSFVVLPAFAGCLQQDEGEALDRGDVARAPPTLGQPGGGWAPRADAQIRPGVPISTGARECPTNFLFIRPDNTSVFLGTTAHCMRDLTVGALVTVGGPENLAVLVYSSWITMAEKGEDDPHAREYNDFAVVRIDSSSRDRVNPSMLGILGPTGMADAAAVGVGSRVLAYGAPPAMAAGWHEALVTGRAGDWALLTHSPLPTAPGSMGGAVVTPEGHALGVVVNLGVAPNPGSNGVARLDALMAYAKENAKLDMVLVPGETV